MNSELKVYCADLVNVTLAGLLLDTGWDDGEFLSIKPQAEEWMYKVGADGQVVVSRVANRVAVAELKLAHTSDGNGRLSFLLEQARGDDPFRGIGSFLVRDRSSGVRLAFASHAVIQKRPDTGRGKEAGVITWPILLPHAVLDYAGAPTVP